MADYADLQKAAAYAAQDTIKFADEDEEGSALQQFHEEVSPETVLALIAENDAARKELGNLRTDNAQLIYALKQQEQSYLVLRAERDQLRVEVAGLKTGYEAYERVNAELKAENEALRKDAERYRWLRQARGGYIEVVEWIGPHATGMTGEDLDALLDAAMGKGEQS